MKKKVALIFFIGMVLAGIVFLLMSMMSQKPVASTAVAAPPGNLPTAPVASAVLENSETQAFTALLSPNGGLHSTIYEVKSGDHLTSISKKFHVTGDLLRKLNKLSSDRLMPGMKLKISTYKFSVVIDKSQNTLILKGDEEVLKTYSVSTGTNNGTPIGVFKIKDKLINPTWYKAGAVVAYGSPKNVLGTRWMGITKQGYGIHGTTEPEKIGQQVTAGCVRMRNQDVEELYGFLPVGTEVTIVD